MWEKWMVCGGREQLPLDLTSQAFQRFLPTAVHTPSKHDHLCAGKFIATWRIITYNSTLERLLASSTPLSGQSSFMCDPGSGNVWEACTYGLEVLLTTFNGAYQWVHLNKMLGGQLLSCVLFVLMKYWYHKYLMLSMETEVGKVNIYVWAKYLRLLSAPSLCFSLGLFITLKRICRN